LPAYLKGSTFRYNWRKRSDLFADTLAHLMKAEAVPFKKLVSAGS